MTHQPQEETGFHRLDHNRQVRVGDLDTFLRQHGFEKEGRAETWRGHINYRDEHNRRITFSPHYHRGGITRGTILAPDVVRRLMNELEQIYREREAIELMNLPHKNATSTPQRGGTAVNARRDGHGTPPPGMAWCKGTVVRNGHEEEHGWEKTGEFNRKSGSLAVGETVRPLANYCRLCMSRMVSRGMRAHYEVKGSGPLARPTTGAGASAAGVARGSSYVPYTNGMPTPASEAQRNTDPKQPAAGKWLPPLGLVNPIIYEAVMGFAERNEMSAYDAATHLKEAGVLIDFDHLDEAIAVLKARVSDTPPPAEPDGATPTAQAETAPTEEEEEERPILTFTPVTDQAEATPPARFEIVTFNDDLGVALDEAEPAPTPVATPTPLRLAAGAAVEAVTWLDFVSLTREIERAVFVLGGRASVLRIAAGEGAVFVVLGSGDGAPDPQTARNVEWGLRLMARQPRGPLEGHLFF